MQTSRTQIEKGKKYYQEEGLSNQSENRYLRNNMIKNRPKGFIIMDTWNNKFFPMDLYQVDTMTFNTSRIQDQFHERYGGSKRDLFLPWHYTVEIVDEKPFIINTRPFTIKSGFPGYEDWITILIIGDSSKDIYPGKFYKQIAHGIMNQFYFFQRRIQPKILYWTKENFKHEELEKELYV